MTGFLMVYSLHSDGRYDGEFLSNYAYINLQNELLKIDGVGKVSIMGAGEYAMRVWLRPDVLKYYGIAVGEVTAAIEKQGGIYPAGQFGAEPAPDGVAYTYTVTMPPQISTAAEFADIVVRTTSSGEQIRLGDIAEVSLGSQTYGVSSSYESDPTAMIVIYSSRAATPWPWAARSRPRWNASRSGFRTASRPPRSSTAPRASTPA